MKFNISNAQRIAQVVMACFLCLVSSTALAGSQVTANPEFAAIDAYVTARMKDLRIPGVAIGIVKDDQILYLRGFGVADPYGRLVTPQTPFRLASVSKTITTLAIMQLVEAGKIELDAPVQRYLPWFRVRVEPMPGQDESSTITVRHLLYHTSGIPQSAGNDNFFNGDLSDAALENNVRQLTRVALNRPVGTTYQYANLNYEVLGLIVQAVSGQSYEAYIQEHLFTPLSIHGSFTSQDEARAHGLATGYRQWFGFPVPTSLYIIGLSVVLTWLCIQTQGNLVITILFHFWQSYFVFINGGISLTQQLWLLTAMTTAISLVLILVYGPNLQRSPVKETAVVDAV